MTICSRPHLTMSLEGARAAVERSTSRHHRHGGPSGSHGVRPEVSQGPGFAAVVGLRRGG